MTHPVEQLSLELTNLLDDEVAERPDHRTVMISRRQLRAAISLAHLYLLAREKAVIHNGDKPDIQHSLTPISDCIDPDLQPFEKKISKWQTTKIASPSTPTQPMLQADLQATPA